MNSHIVSLIENMIYDGKPTTLLVPAVEYCSEKANITGKINQYLRLFLKYPIDTFKKLKTVLIDFMLTLQGEKKYFFSQSPWTRMFLL